MEKNHIEQLMLQLSVNLNEEMERLNELLMSKDYTDEQVQEIRDRVLMKRGGLNLISGWRAQGLVIHVPEEARNPQNAVRANVTAPRQGQVVIDPKRGVRLENDNN